MRNKFLLIFVLSMGIIVPALVADDAITLTSTTAVAAEEVEEENTNPPFSLLAENPDGYIVTPTYEAKEDKINCHAYAYKITDENGNVSYDVLDDLITKEGYKLINDVYGEKIICEHETGSICTSCGCGVIVTP